MTDLRERFAEAYPESSGAAPWTIEYADAMARAAQSIARDDAEDALAALREIEALGYELSGWLGHAHLMYALAFEELADPNEEASHLLARIHPGRLIEGESWGFLSLAQLPFALHRLAELAEARGDTAAAIEYYRQLLDLWEDADPELQPTVRDVKQRLAKLVGER